MKFTTAGFEYSVPEIPEDLQNPQTEREQKLLEILKQYKELLTKDFATGLVHREEFFRKTKDQKGVYIYLDGDGLKRINDFSKSHAMGDQAIKEFAQAIQAAIGSHIEKAIGQTLRGGIVPSRMGGDEFSVFIPDIDSLEVGEKVATRILEQIRKHKIVGTGLEGEHLEFPLTASLGVGHTPEDADKALYKAKEKGRNRVEIYEGAQLEQKVAYLKMKRLYKEQKYNLIIKP